jgi:hypothetical protein
MKMSSPVPEYFVHRLEARAIAEVARAGGFSSFLLRSLIAIFVFGNAPAQAQSTRPVTQPSAPGLEVHEWAVFVLDASNSKINEDGFVQSTLPEFVNTRRQTPAKLSDRACPIGVIRLDGAADGKVDVQIEKIAGTFLSSWPKAQVRTNQLLWQDLTVTYGIGARALEKVGSTTWFDRLRQTDSDYLLTDNGTAERFLLYDIELPYTCAISAKSLPNGVVSLNNTGTVPLHDLVLYRTDHGKLIEAAVGELPVVKAAANPRANPPAGPATKAVAKMQAKTPATAPAAEAVAHLAGVAATQPIGLASAWKPTLLNAGLSTADADLAVDVIAQYAVNTHSLTAVYRLDDAEFDRLLPLEVVPEPKKIVRVGLVIVRNLDPLASNEIDDLIAQMGDPSWPKRQAAYDALKALGSAATTRLQAATKNKDVEIAWRAERLLAAKSGQP